MSVTSISSGDTLVTLLDMYLGGGRAATPDPGPSAPKVSLSIGDTLLLVVVTQLSS